MRSLVAFALAVLFAGPVSAAELQVTLRTPGGQPVGDAVVTVYPATGTPGGPMRFDWPYRMAQKNIQFSPFVLVVPVGATVAFPNLDPVRHHVYSFSPAHRFELKLYGKDETETVRFDKAGAVALGCNIHDQMVAFIKVVDTPFAAKSDAGGEARAFNLPAGRATVRIWHPYLKAPGNEIVRTVTLTAQGVTRDTASLDVRPPPMRHHSTY
jgi:plastocyanin